MPRDEQGQRLDAARAAFRAEWQAKVDRKRRQSVRARGVATQIRRDPVIIPIVGGCFWAVIYVAALLQRPDWSHLPVSAVLGYTIGFVLTCPLILVGLLVAKLCHQWADGCERSADLMEPTKRPHSR